MGADTFLTRAKGANARKAFHAAVEEAKYEYGHRAYTGTIAEKHDFVLIAIPGDFHAYPDLKGFGGKPVPREEQYAARLIEKDDPRINDKWGPAGCIAVDGGFLFFGWASS